ncbi:hypothetical protein EWI07_01405 [Sporolactobacillus sp. THM7-4]|nr:hypothetical protein EWI07_01405 [Sporolactobacillus sp. THM7-4]
MSTYRFFHHAKRMVVIGSLEQKNSRPRESVNHAAVHDFENQTLSNMGGPRKTGGETSVGLLSKRDTEKPIAGFNRVKQDGPKNILKIIRMARGVRIVAVYGQYGKLETADIDACEGLIAGSDAVLLQLDVPVGVMTHAADLARKHRVKVVLDPAPLLSLDEKLRRLNLAAGGMSKRFFRKSLPVRGYLRPSGSKRQTPRTIE